MPTYSRTILKTRIATRISGTISDTDLSTIINNAVTEVISDVDLEGTRRKSLLSPKLFDDIFDYASPADLKSIIDIAPQVKRGKLDEWRLTTPEEFDRIKEDMRVDQWGDPVRMSRSQWLGESLIAIETSDFIQKIRLSRPLDDRGFVADNLDSLGTWVLFGDGTNLTLDSSNFVVGSASINWDISAAGGTTAGIQNSALSAFDLTEMITSGSVFVWAFISSTTNITNYKVRLGSSASAYYEITVTTTNEGTAFAAGWNLLRFDMANKTTTGSPTDAACTYAALFMTKAAGKVSETDYRFDWLTVKLGEYYYVIYYSLFGWQTSSGAYIENSTADADLLNVKTDDIRLIEYKAVELGERHLRSGKANDALSLYTAYVKKYQSGYPSEAKILTSTYHFLNN